MVVLICLIFSVLSTIKEYAGFANETLFYMVRQRERERPPSKTHQHFRGEGGAVVVVGFPFHYSR